MHPVCRIIYASFALLFCCISLQGGEAIVTPEPITPEGIESTIDKPDTTCLESEDETRSAEYVNIFETPEEAAAFIAPELQTGSLIFTRGDCLAVRIYTRSPYTHVAAVVEESDGLYVYDSMNPMGVRKLSLTDYLSTQQPDELHLLHPETTLTGKQQEAFIAALEDRMGTPYGVRHHLTGKRAEGVHCAEFVIDALAEGSIMRANNPPRVSPASLLNGGVQTGRYRPVRSFAIHPPAPPEVVCDSWCEQMWVDTKECSSYCWIRFRKLVFCH